MIEVEGLTKYYGERAAVSDLSFKVEAGEVLGFLGPNGAGKTSTMRMLTSYLPPSSGTARIAGYDIVKDSLEVRKRIGYLPESAPLYPEMTVGAYLDYMARLRQVPNRRARITEVMEQVDIDDRVNQRIGTLSKGYRQRVGLAQALIHDPQLLILDEPTIGLDPRQIIEVRELIRRLGQNHTVILSTHILPEVSQVCDRVIIINRGRLVAMDTPERLTSRLQGTNRVRLVLAQPSSDVPDALRALPGVTSVQPLDKGAFEIECHAQSNGQPDSDSRPAIAALAVNRGWGLLELRSSGLSLEDIFLELTNTDPGDSDLDDSDDLDDGETSSEPLAEAQHA
jgi:ABC-2 type transport system ATP-binding protein